MSNEHTHDIGCLEAIEALYAYLDGELEDDATIAEMEEHISHCKSCYSRSQMERALSQHMKETAATKTPAELQDRLRALMKKL